MTHKCPGPGCAEQVPTELLACRKHWFAIPGSLRAAVWASFRGPGPGSAAHTAAITAAVDYLNPPPPLELAPPADYHLCPGCGRVMSAREAAEQGACNDCNGGAW